MIYDPTPVSRICRACRQWFFYADLVKHKNMKDGVDCLCLNCKRIKDGKYRQNHLEDKREKDRRYYATHKAEFAEYGKKHRAKNKDRFAARAHAYYESHREERRKYRRSWYLNNKERVISQSQAWYYGNREDVLKKRKAAYVTNRLVIRERQKKSYLKARDKRIAYIQRWQQKNAEKTKVYKHRNRTRRHGLPEDFTAADWLFALEYWRNCCAVCGRPRGLWRILAADHWIPMTDPRLDNPGTVPTNIVPLCHGLDGCNNAKRNSDPIEWLEKKMGSKRKAAAKLREIEAFFATVRK